VKFKILLFSTILLIANLIGGKEWVHPQGNKKENLSICAIIKNEAKYIKEWIEFHRLVGVGHFYLYNNNSSDNLNKVLLPYIKKGIVTLIYWPDFIGEVDEDHTHYWSLSTQVTAFENAIQFRAAKKTKWLAILNVDEYLVPVEPYTMEELLKKYDAYPGIILTTDNFDGSRVNLSPPKRMLIESRELIKPSNPNKYKACTKLILKPDRCLGFTWPPYQAFFKNKEQPIEIRRNLVRINHYLNRDVEFIDGLKHNFYADRRKLSRSELSSLLDQGYAVEDPEQAIYRYLPDLMKQFDLGVGR